MNKNELGALAVVIGLIAYAIYIWQTVKKEGVQPHPFSWFLWALVTLVAYLVQRSQGAGPGSWVTLMTVAVCVVIAILTWSKHRWNFSLFDKVLLSMGLVSLSIYILASMFAADPTWSVILATVTDVLGYGPTIKKGWTEPYKDSATSFALNGAKFISPACFCFLAPVCSLGSYSVATWLYPRTLVIVNLGVAIMLCLRRCQIVKHPARVQ